MVARPRRLFIAVGLFVASGCTPSDVVRQNLLVTRSFVSSADVPASLAGDPYFIRALRAETTLSRAAFVPRRAKPFAGMDVPLPIGWSQTISDPYIVAVMTAVARVRAGTRALEIGTGSGYQAAVLSRLGAHVATIEIVPQLARRAARTLQRQGMRDVATRQGDGFQGWPERAPFDAIIVTAGARSVPAPLMEQLAPGGTLVMPIGPGPFQEQLEVLHKGTDERISRCTLGLANFVPLTGRGEAPPVPGLTDQSLPLCLAGQVT